MKREEFHTLLEIGLQYGASDIHFRANEAPGYRVHGAFSHLKHDKLSVTDIEAIAAHVIGDPELISKLDQIRETDTGFGVANIGRFRAHIYRQRGNLALVLRVIPPAIKSFDELGLPELLGDLALLDRGLVLVCGPSSSGKTTTLASMLDFINRRQRYHIVTVEQPIEFLHTPHQSSVTQRQIGRDTDSLADALAAAQRQDPDMVMIGALQTQAEIDLALGVAESGALVLSCVNAGDVEQCLVTLEAAFPAPERTTLRDRLAANIRAIVAQKLLRRADGQARVVACEVFLANLKGREIIRDAQRRGELSQLLEQGKDQGMRPLDHDITRLLSQGLISREVALANAHNRAELERRLTLGA